MIFLKKVFEPVKLNNLQLKNRLVRSATWEGIALPDGGITEDFFGLKVRKISDVKEELRGRSVLVAMGEKNAMDIMDKIDIADAVILWE